MKIESLEIILSADWLIRLGLYETAQISFPDFPNEIIGLKAMQWYWTWTGKE